MFKMSTGLRNKMLGEDSFKAIMAGAVLRIYAGTVPATADAAVGGATLLSVISDDASGDPLAFDDPVGDTIAKDPAQTWRGVNAASGTAAFWRLEDAADDGSASTSAARIQGLCGNVGSDMNLADLTLTATASQSIDYFYFTLPTA